MKKESVNTFNEGINLDLNPITTPSNVLTDCINGTFITFNGDELALQTDAGNTTVNVVKKVIQGDTIETVRLSDGFYPLGVEEYGGVLYIISGKEPDKNVLEFNDANIYSKGEIVYTTRNGVDYYFESLSDNNLNTLPYQSTKN